MNIKKETPEIRMPEAQDSHLRHAMSEDGERYTTLDVSGKPGCFQASLSTTEGASIAPKEFGTIPDARKWLEREFRRTFPKHQCNPHCWKCWLSFAEFHDVLRGPTN
jgi:hypothetical protein